MWAAPEESASRDLSVASASPVALTLAKVWHSASRNPGQARPGASVGVVTFSCGQPPCCSPVGGRPPTGWPMPLPKNSEVQFFLKTPCGASSWVKPVGSPGTTQLFGSREYCREFQVR